ncbi:MAG TPA: hypothetical protein VH419_12890, partial [Nocardioidaceae bacterium]
MTTTWRGHPWRSPRRLAKRGRRAGPLAAGRLFRFLVTTVMLLDGVVTTAHERAMRVSTSRPPAGAGAAAVPSTGGVGG